MTERPRRKPSVLPGLLLGSCPVALLLVLSLGLVPVWFDLSRPRSRQGADRTIVNTLASASRLYMLDHDGRPPRTLDELVTGDKVYLTDAEEIPRDSWGRPFRYQVPGPDGEPFLIACWGADGRPGGDGENGDIIASKHLGSW